MKKLLVVIVFLCITAFTWATPLTADLNHDGIVDLNDFTILADQWLQTSYELQDYWNTDGVTYTLVGSNLNGGIVWQTFIADSNYTLHDVNLLLSKNGVPNTVAVSIRATDGTFPVGDDLCFGTTNGNTLPDVASPEWRKIVLDPPIQLIGGTRYAILLRSNDYTLWSATIYQEYLDGISGNFIGAVWTPWIPVMTCLFETYGY
jgi:hypothetical protein